MEHLLESELEWSQTSDCHLINLLRECDGSREKNNYLALCLQPPTTITSLSCWNWYFVSPICFLGNGQKHCDNEVVSESASVHFGTSQRELLNGGKEEKEEEEDNKKMPDWPHVRDAYSRPPCSFQDQIQIFISALVKVADWISHQILFFWWAVTKNLTSTRTGHRTFKPSRWNSVKMLQGSPTKMSSSPRNVLSYAANRRRQTDR